jgi:hypothetical protein
MGATALAPLQAQDADTVYAALFHSMQQEERHPEPPPSSFSPFQLDHRFRRSPRSGQEKKREFNKIETVKPAPVDKPRAIAKPAQISANPHLALMTDPTLVPGDIVVFPNGPRVFQGRPGNSHAMADFVPFSKATGLSNADRRYLTALRTGVNDAWVEASEATKVAQKTRDVDTTGSVFAKRNKR